LKCSHLFTRGASCAAVVAFFGGKSKALQWDDVAKTPAAGTICRFAALLGHISPQQDIE
jgi:hypothetical protein